MSTRTPCALRLPKSVKAEAEAEAEAEALSQADGTRLNQCVTIAVAGKISGAEDRCVL